MAKACSPKNNEPVRIDVKRVIEVVRLMRPNPTMPPTSR